MEQEKQEKKESFKQKRSKKSYVIETIIVLFVMCAVCVGIGFLDVYGRERNLDTQLMMIIGDAFWVPGCFGICLWGLLFTASAGAFDMIVYGVRKLFEVTFNIGPERSRLPATYFDYVTIRRAKTKNRNFPLLIISGVFFLVGAVFSLLYVIQSV